MRNRKTQNAEFLFDTVGMIDDDIIAEAETPFAAKLIVSARKKKTRSLFAAACAILVIAGGILGNILKFPINLEAPPTPNESTESTDLEQTLIHATHNPDVRRVSVQEIDFFTVTPHIVWQFEGQSEYYMVEVAYQSEENKLKNELKKEGKQMSPDAASQVPMSVWVILGDGTVVSPYLKNTVGNQGYAVLFDYSPEIKPTDGFTKLVNDLLC